MITCLELHWYYIRYNQPVYYSHNYYHILQGHQILLYMIIRLYLKINYMQF